MRCEVEGCTRDAEVTVRLDSGEVVSVCAACCEPVKPCPECNNYETLHCPSCGRVRYCPECKRTVAACAHGALMSPRWALPGNGAQARRWGTARSR